MDRLILHTSFMGRQLIYHGACASTNAEAVRLVNTHQVQEGALVITDHQTAGRGQRDNIWESAAGQNLTFSVVLYPDIPVARQFYLNVVASLAVTDALESYALPSLKVKWPNDIYCLNNKICGILIQNNLKINKIQSSVVGMGINVNQKHFSFPQATSLLLLKGKTFERENILSALLGFFEKRYLQLKNNELHALISAYRERMYWLGETRRFADQHGAFQGEIQDVSEVGQLQVRAADGLRLYNFKEIQYIE